MPEHVSIDDPTEEPHAELFETPRPRAVRLSLDAGRSMPAHTHPESDVLLHVVEGRMTVELDGEAYDCEAGDLLRFDGRREVAPRAETDAVAVVTFAPRATTDG
ncbi:cupin domain-containing protein [Haloglomus litoreum]|uniref:cupin domain-containing protein n=1 Tax=Haloglomus litoreum TaxID=3034026 RepID=UPI0023E8F1A3|nr:cupin domain-containing protein [Haloglomus sp. DT116]